MFNKIIIVGRVGQTPTIKTAKSGNQFATFSVAVDNGWGENKTTDWYNVTSFGKLADSITKFVIKGSLVCVSGSIRLNTYKDKNGIDKARLELTADSVNSISTHVKHNNEQTNEVNHKTEAQSPFSEDFPF